MVVRTQRRGFSLLEVLIALTIFLLSMIAIGRLVILAGDHAAEVKLSGQATLLCQAKLAEVAAGVVPLNSQGDMPFEEDPDWHWSLQAEQNNVAGLWRIEVKVTRQQGDSKVECVMHQFLLDPSLRGSTLDPPTTPIGSSKTSSSSGNTTSSSSDSSSTSGQSTGGSQGGGASKGGAGKKGP